MRTICRIGFSLKKQIGNSIRAENKNLIKIAVLESINCPTILALGHATPQLIIAIINRMVIVDLLFTGIIN